MNPLLRSIILLIFLGACKKQTPEETSSLADQIDSLVTSEHQAKRFDGTLVVGNKEDILYERAIGISNRIWNIPMRLDHRFDICSINKSFIAMLILIACEEDKLSLDNHLTDLLKNYTYSGQFHPDITLHQMLTHTAGLPDYGQIDKSLSANKFQHFKRKHFSNKSYVDFISNVKSIDEPNKQFYYSNFAYHLLAIILEDAYGLSFPELLQEKISNPLGLNHTISSISNEDVFGKMADAYNYDKDTDSWQQNQFIDLTLGRRIFSSAGDLYLWGKEMNNSLLLTEKSMALMQTNHLKSITPDISYGYGWVIFDGDGKYRMGDLGIDRQYIIHGGTTEGFKSMLVNIENGEYIIAFLSNTGSQTDELALTKKIIQLLIKNEE
ncbi:MAG: serine hydrolase domain-containing protein [Ekhidna sp.]